MSVLFRALVWSSLFIAFVLVYIPAQLVSPIGLDRTLSGPLQIFGSSLGFFGASLAVWSIASLVRLGRGTPAPFDPPRKLVTRGPYRYVRNPMYIGAGIALLGAAITYESWMIAGYVAFLFIIIHFFVIFYEEPRLRRSFGSDYVEYCEKVHRWNPLP
jgi:protein-S-isoprenylcysteine O-methyltransferase Ste14